MLKKTLLWSAGQQLLTVSILEYDHKNETYINIPLNNLGHTHIVLIGQDSVDVREVVIADVDVDGDGDPEAVILLGADTLCLFDIHRPAGSRTIYGCSIEILQVNLDAKMSRFHHGDVDGNGQEELAYLAESSNGNLVHFLSWNPLFRSWQNIPEPLWHGRPDNRAVDVAIGDFNDDNIAEVGILMEQPHRNIYRVFHMVNGIFEDYGLW